MVVKLENTNNTPITNTTTQESETKPASMNSVMVSDQETKTSEPKETSRLTCNDFSELQPETDSNVIKTHDDFKKEAEKIFNRKGIKYSKEVLEKLIGNLPNEQELLDGKICNQYLDIISKVLDKCIKNGKLDENASNVFKEYKIGLASGWTAEEFEKRKKEYSKNFNIKEAISKFEELSKKENVSKEELKKEFGLILANATDEEKSQLFNLIKTKFNNDDQVSLIKLFFESFDNKEKRTEIADSMDYSSLYNNNAFVNVSTIVKYMSAEKVFDILKTNEKNFQDLIDKYGEKSVKEAINNINIGKIQENELYKTLSNWLDCSVATNIGISQNENMSKEEIQKASELLENTMKQSPGLHDLYIDRLAEYVMNNRETLNIDVDKFKDFIKKVTGNDEFSRALDNIAEQKSAVDPKTGLLKTDSNKAIEAQINANNISKNIAKQTQEADEQAQQPEPVSPIEKVKTFLADKEFDTNITLFDTKEYANNTFKAVKAIFTGKVKVASQDEDKALDKYKILNSAEQTFILGDAANSWLQKIVKNTKDSVLLAFQGVGANSYATKEIQNAKIEAEKNKQKLG